MLGFRFRWFHSWSLRFPAEVKGKNWFGNLEFQVNRNLIRAGPKEVPNQLGEELTGSGLTFLELEGSLYLEGFPRNPFQTFGSGNRVPDYLLEGPNLVGF